MKRSTCKLTAPGWTPKNRLTLQRLIQNAAGKSLPVVLDFDNTIICGDIGEATLAILAKSGKITPDRLLKPISPAFRPGGRRKFSLSNCSDVTQYYEAFLAPTVYGAQDRTPLVNGYVWAVEVMEGLTPLEVTQATQTAFQLSRDGNPAHIEVTPGKTSFPAPFFYPEMVELLAQLLHHQFDLWIFSASNVWSVRWMVLHALNPLLRQHGVKTGISPDHVIGISMLLQDRANGLHKDELLVRHNHHYAALHPATLRSFKLTSRLQFPVPAYSGKVACILDKISRRPFLAIGDGQGDHSMLAFSEHRLWLARLEKPADQHATTALLRRYPGDWIVQPLLSRKQPRFVSDLSNLHRSHLSPEVRASLRTLASMDRGLP